MTKFIAIYVRVSSKQQSTRSQLPDLRQWAEGQDQPVRWYTDQVTGRTMNRPEWNKLEGEMRLGRVASLVVWRLDRCGRTASGLTKMLDEIQHRNINFISLKDGIDLATPAGRMMAGVLASLAQYETEVRGERTRAGMEAAKAKALREGVVWKRGGVQKGSHYKVSYAQIRVIRQMKLNGEPISQIAKALSLSRPTVYKILAQYPD